MYISENCNWTPYGTNTELDKMVDSDDWEDRESAARHSYGLDILINDEDQGVREEVAWQGYGLDILINDEGGLVRRSVATRGYGLDKLINDEYSLTREEVNNYLEKHHLTLSQWIKQNPDKCVLEHNDNQLTEVTKDFIYKINDSNKLTVLSQYESINEFFNSEIDNDTKINTLVICAVDTKEPLFKVEKLNFNNQINYKFIVEITTDKGDDFIVRSIIQSQDQLNKLIQQTVDALNLYEQFNKYAEDLENCL